MNVLSKEVGEYTINIVIDIHPENPRDWDNLGTFIGRHRKYVSPDRIPNGFELDTDVHIFLPVWLYDHSGTCYIAAHYNPFSCPWDSGQFGYIFVAKDKVREEFGVKRISAKLRKKVEACLKAEVEAYNRYADGEVYGYEIVKDGGVQDSCYGFFDTPEEVMKLAEEELG